MKKFSHRSSIWPILLCAPSLLVANPHFYRPENFIHQPIPYQDEVLRFNVSLFGGSTKKGRNAAGEKTDVLSIYGPQNIGKLAANVMTANSDLKTLADVNPPSGSTFGLVNFCGKFSYAAAYIEGVRCFHKNWFVQAILPIQWLRVGGMCPTVDLTPTTGDPRFTQNQVNFADIKDEALAEGDNGVWNMDGILNVNRMSNGPSSATYIGDTTVYLGYAYEGTAWHKFDHTRMSVKAGLLFPTAKRKNENQAFSIPGGYDGHFAIPVSFDGYIGNPGMQVGGHLGSFWFFNHTKDMRVKSALPQNGFIKLAKGKMNRQLGAIFTGGAFVRVRSDHLGFTFGYSYARQGNGYLKPQEVQTDPRYAIYNTAGGIRYDYAPFSEAIINSDEMLKKWVMQAFHLNLEYHESDEDYEGFTARIYYNRPVTGTRIFNTQTIGAGCGASLLWKF